MILHLHPHLLHLLHLHHHVSRFVDMGSLGDSVSGALRTFAYFLASGTHYMLEDVEYLSLFGTEPSAIEMVFAIYANVLEVDEHGVVVNAKHAEKRATGYLRSYCDPRFTVEPPYEDWELALHPPPSSS